MACSLLLKAYLDAVLRFFIRKAISFLSFLSYHVVVKLRVKKTKNFLSLWVDLRVLKIVCKLADSVLPWLVATVFDVKNVHHEKRWVLQMKRLSWEQYALRLAQVAALRSEDPYVQVGAVVLRPDNSVAGIGYNGAPAGVTIDWSCRDARRPYVVHAEVNALRYVKPHECSMLIVTLAPCSSCLTVAATYGIKQIRYQHDFVDGEITRQMAEAFGIELKKIDHQEFERTLHLSI